MATPPILGLIQSYNRHFYPHLQIPCKVTKVIVFVMRALKILLLLLMNLFT